MTIRLAVLALCIGLFGSAVSSATAKPTGRVVMRQNVSRAHRDELVTKLRKITGWSKLTFTTDGILSIDSQETFKGSRSARVLLSKAVAGENVIVLEDASARADVAFCRVVPGRWRTPHAFTATAYVVLIDFADFEQIIGDEAARESFDVGWALLHELDHVVMDSEDTAVNGHVGECESHINLMRSELGLPLRANYFFTSSALKTDPNFSTRFVRLPFEQRDASSKRLKRYWLTWDSSVVGGFEFTPARVARSSIDIF